jgi:carbamoyltransferase
MKICGIKLTHDASVAVIEDGKLLFSIEAEKIANNPRYSTLSDYSDVEQILRSKGLTSDDIDQFVIDGWDDGTHETDFYELNRQSEPGTGIRVATYGRQMYTDDILNAYADQYDGIRYRSYYHTSGHVFGAYCTSPFAKKGEDAFILVWDGGIYPLLFYYHYHERRIENLLPLFTYNGDAYRAFAHKFEPFSKCEHNDLSIAGKVMAYIALGECDEALLRAMHSVHRQMQPCADPTATLIDNILVVGKELNIDSRDMIATFHVFLEQLLVESLRERISALPSSYERNLAFAGGCALNIKWNQAIRNSGIFEAVWIPPFPNDSGSAIGTACCEMILKTPYAYLDWNVYSGPAIGNTGELSGWNSTHARLEELAAILHHLNEPILFLNGLAELGPRALGNRSILAPTGDESMKAYINEIKKREDYRPVAPICLEEFAPELFEPGTPDPYMLYDHRVREGWIGRIPAVCHLDGTARLQTVNANENPEIYQLLQCYRKLSGLPLLCNTSANLNGSGFFPDITTAMKWGKIDFIFCEGKLYYKAEREHMMREILRRELVLV